MNDALKPVAPGLVRAVDAETRILKARTRATEVVRMNAVIERCADALIAHDEDDLAAELLALRVGVEP